MEKMSQKWKRWIQNEGNREYLRESLNDERQPGICWKACWKTAARTCAGPYEKP